MIGVGLSSAVAVAPSNPRVAKALVTPDEDPFRADEIVLTSPLGVLTRLQFQKCQVYGQQIERRRRRRRLATTRLAAVAETAEQSDTMVYPHDRQAIASRWPWIGESIPASRWRLPSGP